MSKILSLPVDDRHGMGAALIVFGKDSITTSYLKLNIHSIKTVLSIVVYLTFNDYDMTVMMICSCDDDSPSVTDYNDDFMYHFFAF